MRDLLYNVYYMSGTALKLFNVDCVDIFLFNIPLYFNIYILNVIFHHV